MVFDTLFAYTRMVNAKQSLVDAVAALEKARGNKVFCLIQAGKHHICGPTLRSVISRRDQFKGIETLDVVLHSPGGHALIAYQIIKFFKRRCKSVNIIIPLQAKSAATLMCFGADEILMGEFAELGPLDVQINDPMERGSRPFSPLDEFKSMEFLREYAVELLDYFTYLFIVKSGMSVKEAIHESIPCVSGMMRPLYERIDPLEVGGHRRALAIGEEYATRLLKATGNQNHQEIVQHLVWKYPSHDFVVDIEEAKGLGLPASALPLEYEQPLTAAILEMEEDECLHGFLPKQAQKVTPARAKRTAGLRKRVNGSIATANQSAGA